MSKKKIDFPSRAARRDYLLKKELSGGGSVDIVTENTDSIEFSGNGSKEYPLKAKVVGLGEDNPPTQIVAGDGLTEGVTSEGNRTLSVKFGTTEGTAAQGNDPRLSDSREWSAEIVSQEEAEAGTSTTPRKWTAQRVRQAYDAAWEESKGELLSNSNIFTEPQVIYTNQSSTTLALATNDPESIMIQFAMGMDSDNPVGVFFGATPDGNLGTGVLGTLDHVVHTSRTLPIRTKWDVENYTGRGVTLAEDARAALELGSPTPSYQGYLYAGRNSNITIDGDRVVIPQYNQFGTGEFASITIRSDSATPRTVRLNTDILNKRDFEEEYTVTDTEALYLEGRYVDSGFMITFLTMYPIPPTNMGL